ncbi:MAG: GAF domain-containing protein [Alistipes sp.]|nr:GAF domain-containing protein [Alistipes sp.]
MAETLIIAEGDKQQKYELLYRQIEAVVSGEKDTIANMANIATMIHSTFGFWWTGFYRVIDNELVLGPFQGPVACTRIERGKGVCGTSWSEQRTIIVDDVDAFPGHIACSSESRSEIVVPIWRNENIIAVLDIDSSTLATFDSTDQEWLERIARLVGR